VKPAFAIELLADRHDRASFVSGNDPLDRYLRDFATQDARRRIANCFLAVEQATSRIAGFYTLSAAGMPLVELPDTLTKRLPRYPTLPAVRIGRLAVDRQFHGQGLGSAMLIDAARRAIQAGPAAFLLVVDAKDEEAARFYEHHEFIRLVERPLTLFLPLATAEKTLLR
jgi:ribosomal protein S18 acetylase RimI-like enzyme